MRSDEPERPLISALIIARDAEADLPDCIDALTWVDEIVVVVDAASRDATEVVARSLADRVIVRLFDNFASQRNAALELASGDWIFAIDADERATPALAAEVLARISVGESAYSGFRVPIRSEVLGRPFRYSGTQHDLPLRLFRRGMGRWTGEVHETVDLEGAAGRLREPLLHRTLPDMKTFLRKMDAYTTLEAGRLSRQGRRPRRFDATLRPLWTFLKLYVGKRGFLDGPEGFAFCALSGVSAAVRGWKLRELCRTSDQSQVEQSERTRENSPLAIAGVRS